MEILMSDSKNSYEQKKWESAAASHARASELLTKFSNNPAVLKHLEYWKSLKARIESQYPSLRA